MDCETPNQWADEVDWDIDEEVDTGGVWRAQRSVGAHHVIVLRWQRRVRPMFASDH